MKVQCDKIYLTLFLRQKGELLFARQLKNIAFGKMREALAFIEAKEWSSWSLLRGFDTLTSSHFDQNDDILEGKPMHC